MSRALGNYKGKLRRKLNLSNDSVLLTLQVSANSNVLLIFCDFIGGKFGWWRHRTRHQGNGWLDPIKALTNPRAA